MMSVVGSNVFITQQLPVPSGTLCAYLYTKEMKVEGKVWNDKKWRCIISVNPDEYILTGKNYPYRSDELTGLAYEWVRELTGKADEFKKFEDIGSLYDLDSFDVDVTIGYNDADCGSSECFMVGLNANKECQDYLYVPYNGVPCPKCGNNNHMEGEFIECDHCDDSFYCESCDDRCHGDQHEVTNRWGETEWVCYSCLDYYYRYCDECGEYYHYDDVTHINGDTYCETCRDEKFTYCEKCDEIGRASCRERVSSPV